MVWWEAASVDTDLSPPPWPGVPGPELHRGDRGEQGLPSSPLTLSKEPVHAKVKMG